MFFHPNINKNYKKYDNNDNFLLHDPLNVKFRPDYETSLIRLFGWGLFLPVLIIYSRVDFDFKKDLFSVKWSFLDIIAIQIL